MRQVSVGGAPDARSTPALSCGKSLRTVFQTDRQLNGVILMAQPVADTSDFAPRQTGTSNLRHISETDGRFADYQQFALDCSDGFGIFTEGVEIHPRRKFLDQADSIRNIPQ